MKASPTEVEADGSAVGCSRARLVDLEWADEGGIRKIGLLERVLAGMVGDGGGGEVIVPVETIFGFSIFSMSIAGADRTTFGLSLIWEEGKELVDVLEGMFVTGADALGTAKASSASALVTRRLRSCEVRPFVGCL